MPDFNKTSEGLDQRVAKAREEIIAAKRELLKGDDLFDARTEEELDVLILSDKDAIFRIEAESLFRAMVVGIKSVGNLGQQMLLAMWRARDGKYFMAMDESASVHDALRGQVGDNTDLQYVKAMLQVVEVFYDENEVKRDKESIFEYVARREEAGDPVKSEDGRCLTLKLADDEFTVNLISSHGMISKLKENAWHFSHKLKTDEERDTLLAAIGSGKSREYVKAVKADQKRTSAPVHIKVIEKEKDGKMHIEFKTTKFEMEPREWKRMKKKLEGILEIEL